MHRDYALTLLRHMEWADSLVWRAVGALAAPHADPALRERLLHVHVVQRAFLQMWAGTPVALDDAAALTSLPAVAAWGRPYYAAARALLAGLSEADFARPVPIPWSAEAVGPGRAPADATLAETVVQVATHTAHHRGQLCTQLRALGGEPPLVDFIAWVWLGKPAPAWAAPGA